MNWYIIGEYIPMFVAVHDAFCALFYWYLYTTLKSGGGGVVPVLVNGSSAFATQQ
jgi:hypothetical protein